jgi:transposase InsO family protein
MLIQKGNVDTERVIRTIKEDFVWTREFSSPFEFTENYKEWVQGYNNDYPRSSLNYSTPYEYEKEHLLITTKF